MTDSELCRRCKTATAHLTAYWGHPLCRDCARRTAKELDERGRWPAVPWTADDEKVLADG